MSAVNRPKRRSSSIRSTTKNKKTTSRKSKTISSQKQASDAVRRTSKAAALLTSRVKRLNEIDIDFIPNDSFVGRRDTLDDVSELVRDIELAGSAGDHPLSAGLPSHLGRMCATPLLTQEQEQELFRRMNYCKYRVNALRSRLSLKKPDLAKIREAEDYARRAERLRNYIIQANTRLVMSIGRKFADGRNAFDDLLSHGIGSLMHAVEKFDFSRGYRFSTYATCAVRRDLYRLVMGRKKDYQRFTTGTDEFLSACAEDERSADEMTENGWKHLSGSLEEMIEQLDEREKFIVTYRFGFDESGKRSSYSQLGERLGISKERVRQLANRALDKLREWAPEYRLEGLLS